MSVVPCCHAADVIELKAPAGKTFSYGELKAAVEQHKPTALFVVQVRVQAGLHDAISVRRTGAWRFCLATVTCSQHLERDAGS